MNITNRHGFVGISEDDKDTGRNIRVTVEIVGRLPFFTLAQASGAGDIFHDIDNFDEIHYNIEIADAAVPDIVPAETKNVLVDPDDADRFMTVAKVASILTDKEAHIVYDAKYKDLILIPTLLELGDSPMSVDHLKGSNVVIKGYQVGGRISTSPADVLEFPPPAHVSDGPGFIKPPTTISTKSYIMRLHMRGIKSRYNGGGMQLGEIMVETDSNPLIEVASLGPVGRVFGPNVNVHLNKLIRTDFSNYSLVSSGQGQADDLLLFLPF